MKRFRPAAVIASAALAFLAMPASADQVTVGVTNPGGTRTLYVEDLLGRPLTDLEFGAARSQPFRVRVVDQQMDRSGFQVLSSMTNLYRASGSTYDFGSSVASNNLGLGFPSTPVNLMDVSALVSPLLDMATTIAEPLCTTITTLGGSCTVALDDVQGLPQSVELPVDLSDLSGLPLLPQVGEAGSFSAPDYGGIAAADPAKPANPTPTTRRVLSGTPVSTAAVMSAIQSALADAVAGTPADQLVDQATLAGELRNAIGGEVYDALSPAQVETILDGLTATVGPVVPSQVTAQAGSYLSYPVLNVTVPATTPAGTYRGTLTVTAVQL